MRWRRPGSMRGPACPSADRTRSSEVTNQGVRMSIDVLFTPFSFKGLTLPNRVVMAPMTRSFSPGGVPPRRSPPTTAAAPRARWA